MGMNVTAQYIYIYIYICICIAACRKEAKATFSLSPTGPYRLEDPSLAKHPAASRNYQHFYESVGLLEKNESESLTLVKP